MLKPTFIGSAAHAGVTAQKRTITTVCRIAKLKHRNFGNQKNPCIFFSPEMILFLLRDRIEGERIYLTVYAPIFASQDCRQRQKITSTINIAVMG
jgi:hypothetical protein